MNWKPLVLLLAVGSTHAAIPNLTDEGSLQACAANPALWHELATLEFQQAVGDQKDSSIARTIISSRSLLADVMGSGPLPSDPKKMLRILDAIYKEDGNAWTDPKQRTTAVAVALTFGDTKRKWPEDKAVERYKVYRDSQRAGKLHPSFDQLEVWEKRFVVSYGQNGGYGEGNYDDTALLWQRDNVKLPVEGYLGACWQAPYRSNNVFGDSVHGKNYYMPFTDMNHALRVRDIGGVCGSLSHYGANAARANGIPALTMGEPGHCAYAVRLKRGKWQPSYSLSTNRGLHTSLSGNAWTDLIVQEANMADLAKFRLSQAYLWQAHSLKDSNPELAQAAYNLALQTQPLNQAAWEDLIKWMEKSRKPTPEVWVALHASVIKAFNDYPQAAWKLCAMIEPLVAKHLPLDRRKALFTSYHQAMAQVDGPVAWEYGEVFEAQSKWLHIDEAEAMKYFGKNLALLAGSKQWFAPAIAWGHETFSKQAGWFDLLGSVFTSDAAASNKEGLKNALRPAMLAAEASGNVAAFQALGRAGQALSDAKPPSIEPFAGELLSAGGLIQLSSTCRWDNPELHWGILETSGGKCHTEQQVKPWVSARLGKLGDVSGIIIANGGNGNAGRMTPLTVSISEDGQQWQEVFRTTQSKGPWRIDLQGKAPRVQYVKVMRDDDRKEYFHLSSILVYGRRLQ